MKYSEMHYERINVSDKRKFCDNWLIKFKNAKNSNDQINLLKEAEDLNREYQTYESISSLNFSKNINDVNAKKRKRVL